MGNLCEAGEVILGLFETKSEIEYRKKSHLFTIGISILNKSMFQNSAAPQNLLL